MFFVSPVLSRHDSVLQQRIVAQVHVHTGPLHGAVLNVVSAPQQIHNGQGYVSLAIGD